MEKRRLLISINQFYKGGAETALLNLLQVLSPDIYQIDFLIFDQISRKDSLSLIPQIPKWINVIHAGEREKWFAYVQKAYFRIYRSLTQKQLFRRSVRRYLKDRCYDVAISFGEWFSCAPIATMVRASRKYVWIHADMDKADFLHPDILSYQQYFDQFLFVSEHSRQEAVARYPFLKERSSVIQNLVCEEDLLKKSLEKAESPFPPDGLPLLLTVANIRPEKNHLRQLRAMELLRKEGIHFHWLNIGSFANREQTAQLQQAIRASGLEEDFRLAGAIENPYPYMKAADAVCVLSDHESWSMVITEAKILGVPVIATRTSGALEQIIPGENGVLCEFSAEDIAEKIKEFFGNPTIRTQLRQKLVGFTAQKDVLPKLEQLFLDRRKKLLYLFDDVNYLSGARNAALAQMNVLEESADVSLFSIEPCRDNALSQRYRIFDLEQNLPIRCLSRPFKRVIREAGVPKRVKLLRGIYAVMSKFGISSFAYQFLLDRELSCFLNGYDAIYVVSEASKLRHFVATLDSPRKIQWIHTDYAAWRNYSAWTRAITKQDGDIYRRYDTIVLLSERLKNRFLEEYPHLSEKTTVIPNFINFEEITQKACAPCAFSVNKNLYNIISVGRLEKEKRYDRLLDVADKLHTRNIPFHWYIVGSGELFPEIQTQCDVLGLSSSITLTGMLENPYPLMKQCNLFVLFSDYEGTPITIDEAKVLGLPVLSADIGGIADQLENGKYGKVVQSDVNCLVEMIADAIQCPFPLYPSIKMEYSAYNKAIEKSLKLLNLR